MKKINIFYNENEKSKEILKLLIEKLDLYDFSYSIDNSQDADLNICIGGDGSFLRAIHQANFSQIPFVGINTGRLGFFQEIPADNIDQYLSKIKSSDFTISKLYLLNGKVRSHKGIKEYHALNEFVLSKSNHSVSKIDVFIDDILVENFAGDGLIVSSPSGSTGYNLSVGGAILYQELQGYQLSPIAPISTKAYRSLQNSLVLSKNQKLILKPKSPCDLVADGYHIGSHIDEIEIRLAGKYINKLVFNHNSYWINLKDKFL